MCKKGALLVAFVSCMCHFLVAQEKSGIAERIIEKIESMPDSLLGEIDNEDVKMPMKKEQFSQLMEKGLSSEKPEQDKISLAIKVVDEKTDQPIEAIVNLKAITDKKTAFEGVGMCDEKGIFQLKLSPNSDIELMISFPEYLPLYKSFDFASGNEEEDKTKVHKKYKLTKLVVGEYIQLKKIYFNEGQFKLLKESYEQLNVLVSLMNSHPDMKIEIAGHTDNSGSAKYNQQLSQKRAEAVKQYLVEKGIKSNRIEPVGYGGTKPLIQGNDEESKQQNRRVEFKVIKL